jgi:hypothetical protein
LSIAGKYLSMSKYVDKRRWLKMGFSWTCPFCGRSTTIVNDNFEVFTNHYEKRSAKYDDINIVSRIVHCPHPKCDLFTLSTSTHTTKFEGGRYKSDKLINTWSLIPSNSAMVMPDYIPQPIVDDYNEACLIRDLSPKASATLSRRCLQGMIRDFWGISKKTLFLEIEFIKDKLDSLTWEAIDAVRKIGNIGAHMEKDIDLIIDVEPNEAQLLIELIETLIKEWYVARSDRQQRMNGLVALAKSKEDIKKGQ